jgi:hypothetical protein
VLSTLEQTGLALPHGPGPGCVQGWRVHHAGLPPTPLPLSAVSPVLGAFHAQRRTDRLRTPSTRRRVIARPRYALRSSLLRSTLWRPCEPPRTRPRNRSKATDRSRDTLESRSFPQVRSVTRVVSSATSRAGVFAIQSRSCEDRSSEVSTRDQHPEAQQDALTAADCERIFTDKASGTLARRPGLDNALLVARRAISSW